MLIPLLVLFYLIVIYFLLKIAEKRKKSHI